MWLDLQDRAQVKLTDGHNCKGSNQPAYKHIGAKKMVGGKQPRPATGRVLKKDISTCSYQLSIGGSHMKLGLWWLEAAERGAFEKLPLVNTSPRFAKLKWDPLPLPA